MRSLASMSSRYTVYPAHKKAADISGFFDPALN